MSIRFPKHCKTREQRSAHASRVATIGWERRRKPREIRHIGYIEFGGPLAAGRPMRLDLYREPGLPKWEARENGGILGKRLSERSVLMIVRNVLRVPIP